MAAGYEPPNRVTERTVYQMAIKAGGKLHEHLEYEQRRRERPPERARR